MKKIWKNSTNRKIVISSDTPIIGQYTDETNIANWIGMMRKGIITRAEMHEYVDSYIDNQKKGEMSNYDVKWRGIYDNLPP